MKEVNQPAEQPAVSKEAQSLKRTNEYHDQNLIAIHGSRFPFDALSPSVKGSSIRSYIPYSRQLISDSDVQSVLQVLGSDYLTQGPILPRFESKIAKLCNAKYAVGVSSATAALHLACLALEIGVGDIVWTVPNTFVASSNCARYCGASIDFVDIDPDTGNLSVECLAKKLAHAEAHNLLPKAIIPVHFAGASCDMESIYNLVKPFGIKIIEDASHAIGGKYKNEYVGSCTFSDMTVFSFHPVKIITSAEGGMVTTNSEELSHKLKELRCHGITRDKERMTLKDAPPWYYQQLELGYNYRLNELQATLGLSQAHRLREFVLQRNRKARLYLNAFADARYVKSLHQEKHTYSSWHLFVIRVPAQIRRELYERLQSVGIGVNVHYIPVHTQPDYQAMGFRDGDFPGAERYYSECITLPLPLDITESEQQFIIDEVINGARLLMQNQA